MPYANLFPICTRGQAGIRHIASSTLGALTTDPGGPMSPCRSFAFATTVFAALSAFPMAVLAHEELPPNWCTQEGEEPKVVEEFDFSGPELQEVIDKCGNVDNHRPRKDAWHTTSGAIATYCGIVAPLQSAMPLVLGPETYLSPQHHDTYSIDQGLRGACVVCTPKPE